MAANFSIHVQLTTTLDPRTSEEILGLGIVMPGTNENCVLNTLPEDGLHVYATQGQQVVAHSMCSPGWLQPEGQPPLKTACVSELCCAEAAKGTGIGTRVMRRMAQEIAAPAQEPEYRLAAIATGTPRYYTRLGWKLWRGPLAALGTHGLTPAPAGHRPVLVLRLPATPNLNLLGLLTIDTRQRAG